MIEKPFGAISTAAAAGRIGLASCSYGCRGCPLTRNADALTIRIVGYDGYNNDNVLKTIQSLVGRFIELASGDISPDVEKLGRLRDAGLRRIVIPVFGVGEDHDRRIGIHGSFDKAIEVLEVSKAVGLERMMIARLDQRLDPSEERMITRVAWKHEAALAWTNPNAHEPLCIADNCE